MAESRRRLTPDDRRNELLALGAEVFGQRPYDEVRIDEIAERAGVSRALMYHYFPDKRAFFAAVVRAEGERLFEATNNDRQANRIMARITEAAGGPLDSKLERDVLVIIYGWLAYTFEMCRQRIIDPSIDAGYLADSCAHSLLDAVARVPGIPTLE